MLFSVFSSALHQYVWTMTFVLLHSTFAFIMNLLPFSVQKYFILIISSVHSYHTSTNVILLINIIGNVMIMCIAFIYPYSEFVSLSCYTFCLHMF